MECTKTLYTPVVSTNEMNFDKLCQEKYDYFNLKLFLKEVLPLGVNLIFEHMVNGQNISDYAQCKDALKRFAIVKINLASNTVTRITRSKRVTLTGHIANIGKFNSK